LTQPPATADAAAQDLARTRAALGATLHEIERRLSPQLLVGKGLTMSQSLLDDGSGKAAAMVRRHPIPAAFVAAGVGWLLFTELRATGARGPGARRVAGAVGDGRDEPGARADWLVARVKGATGHGAPVAQAAERAVDAATTGEPQGRLEVGRTRAMGVLQTHPLAIGALAFLSAATLAFLLPSRRGESKAAAQAAASAAAPAPPEDRAALPADDARPSEAVASVPEK
jgi:hypothetical protein